MKIFLTIIACILGLFAIESCKNVIDYGQTEKLTSSSALLKINNVSMYFNNRLAYFKINDQRVSSAINARYPYPGSGYNTYGPTVTTDFLKVNAGSVKLSVVLPKKVDTGVDSLVLYTTTFEVTGGKSYSIHITDTATTTKSVLAQENFTKADSSVARFRFINLIPNVASVDLYYCPNAATAADSIQQRTDSLIIGGANYMQISNEFKMKAGVVKFWKIRPAGAPKTGATVLASYSSASVVVSTRVYQAFACGYSGKTTTAQKPYISFYPIR